MRDYTTKQLDMFDIQPEYLPGMAKHAVLDFETGGTDNKRNALCSVAIVRVDCNFKEIDRYYTLIIDTPDKIIEGEALRINGLTREQIAAEGRPWPEVFAEIKNRLWDCIPVAHNAQFDFGFLRERGYSITHAVCTMENDFALFPAQKHKLGLVYQRLYGSQFAGAHNALGDVLATVQVLKWQVAKDPKYGVAQEINWNRFKR